jgi:hypothetical protein
MNQYEFGYFPRNKYKDLVFYVKTGEHSNMGLFEMDDTEENRAIMDALLPHPYQSERDKCTTRELVDELCKRDSVRCYPRDNPPKCSEISFTKETWGKSTILVIKDLRAGEP